MITARAQTFSLVVGALFVATTWLGAEQSEVRQPVLDAAILAGKATEVHPYLLLESAQGRNTVGAVYTQFVRVARYVWMARQHGRDVDVTDIPASIGRRELHVVMPIPTEMPGAEGPSIAAIDRHPSAPPAGHSVYFGRSKSRLTPSIALITPEDLQRMVGELPIQRAALVGIFGPELAQRTVLEFCAYDPDSTGDVQLVCGFANGPFR